jgi:magnesium transporter
VSGKAKVRRISVISRRRAPAGTAPGTLISHASPPPLSMSLTLYDEAGIEIVRDATIETVAAAIGKGRTLWLDVAGVGHAEAIERIGELFGIDRLALEDVMNLHQRPKADVYPNGIFIVTHMVDGESVATKEQFSLFLGQDFLVTFQERPGDCLDPVRRRLNEGRGRIRKSGAGYLAYAILDALFDAYFPLTEKLGEALEQLEDSIIANPGPANLTEMHRIRRELLGVKRSLWPSREMLASLAHDESGFFHPDTERFLRDIHDHVMQLVDIVETYRELAASLLEFYASTIANRMNEVIKFLTIISTIFIPLSFLAGIWGMNFEPVSGWNMPELHWAYGYPAAIGFMLAAALALLAWFRWKRWL